MMDGSRNAFFGIKIRLFPGNKSCKEDYLEANFFLAQTVDSRFTDASGTRHACVVVEVITVLTPIFFPENTFG